MWSVRSEKGNTLSVRTALRASPCRVLSRLRVRVVLWYIAQHSVSWWVRCTRTVTKVDMVDSLAGRPVRGSQAYDPRVGDIHSPTHTTIKRTNCSESQSVLVVVIGWF